MASLLITVLMILTLSVFANLNTNAESSPDLQRRILEKWYREFSEISQDFDKEVLKGFAADKGFHMKATTSTSTTTTTTTEKPAPVVSDLERESDPLPLSPYSHMFGPVRIRYFVKSTSLNPISEQVSESGSWEQQPHAGIVKKDQPQEQDNDFVPRLLARLLFPESEDDESTFQSDDISKSLEDLPDSSHSNWMSISSKDGTTTSSSTTTTTTTSTVAPSTGLPTTESSRSWNPFTKQGFRRIFHFG